MSPRRVVLVGAGHAHVEVLRRWAERPPPDAHLTLIEPRSAAVYSGMVPGFVAGDYARDEIGIDVGALAGRAGAEWIAGSAQRIVGAAQRIDTSARRLLLGDGREVAWDVAALDIGSTVKGLDLPGVREHALATRPIARFVEEIDDRIVRWIARRSGGPTRIAVVGGGAAGVELAFTLNARLDGGATVLLVAESAMLAGSPARAQRLLKREAAARGIGLVEQARVVRVEADGVVLNDGRCLPADLVVWATGAAAHPLPADSALPTDDAGFVRTRPTLQVEGCDDLFAVGDCAAIEGTVKAGVHAVRGGPVLDANLRARLDGRPLQAFRPQRDFLSLLNLGGRRALATKWGIVATGAPMWTLKDWIDRRFLRRYAAAAESTMRRNTTGSGRTR